MKRVVLSAAMFGCGATFCIMAAFSHPHFLEWTFGAGCALSILAVVIFPFSGGYTAVNGDDPMLLRGKASRPRPNVTPGGRKPLAVKSWEEIISLSPIERDAYDSDFRWRKECFSCKGMSPERAAFCRRCGTPFTAAPFHVESLESIAGRPTKRRGDG